MPWSEVKIHRLLNESLTLKKKNHHGSDKNGNKNGTVKIKIFCRFGSIGRTARVEVRYFFQSIIGTVPLIIVSTPFFFRCYVKDP